MKYIILGATFIITGTLFLFADVINVSGQHYVLGLGVTTWSIIHYIFAIIFSTIGLIKKDNKEKES